MAFRLQPVLTSACVALAACAAAAPVAVSYSTDDFDLAVASDGCLQSMKEKATGRELLRWKGKFASVVTKDDREAKVVGARLAEDGRLSLSFDGVDGAAELSVRKESWGLVFTAERLTVPDVKEFKFFIVYPICRKYNGQMMNAMSDDDSAVVLRTYELSSAMRLRGNTVLEAVAEVAEHPPALPARAALVAAPRSKILDRMKEMTHDAGAVSSPCGGAWSLAAQENRESYLIASMTRESAEDWIALAERGGFKTLSLYNWWQTLGHYDTNTNRYPRGDADLAETIDMIHAAGLKAGMHTLTAGIGFNDTWTRPECHGDLLVTYSYTLAKPFADGDGEMFVGEKPGPKHHFVTSFLSNGNILRVGGELFTYTGIRGDAAPYAFTGVKRGAYGTKKTGTLPAGTKVEYLFQHFFSFFPEPSSPFMDEMAALLAGKYEKFGFDFVYHDGAEPMSRYNIDLTRGKFTAPLARSRRPLQVESSIGGAHNWWFHSRLGAWDHVLWGAKQFHDYHLRHVVTEARNANMLAGQAGWWSLVTANGSVRGNFRDEAEYFASRNAGADLAMSMDGVNVTKGPLSFSVERQMTIVGRYERFRLARAFTEEALGRMDAEGAEFRLGQDDTGTWTLTPVRCLVHRIGTPEDRSWNLDASCNAAKLALRVEALYAPAPGSGEMLIGPADADSLKVTTAPSVKAQIKTATVEGKGEVLAFRALNQSGERRGAWAGATLRYDHPFRDIAKGGAGKAFAFWVHGDGSGAVLDFRISSSKIHLGGQSDHFVTLDFKGWRRVCVLLRERDAHRYGDYVWAGYRPIYPVYRNAVDPKKVEEVGFYLNDVPAGGKATVLVTPVEILAETRQTLRGAVVVAGGSRFEVPFSLESGEYAELDGGVWTHYSEGGEPVGAVAAPVVAPSDAVECRFGSQDDAARAEVTLFAAGVPFHALRPLAQLPGEVRRTLAYEAVDPVVYAPSKGLDRPFAVAVRPGEKARLEFEIRGPVVDPVLSVQSQDGKTEAVELKTALSEGERLVCRDGKTWKVVKDFRAVRTGTLSKPLPELYGACRMKVNSSSPETAHAGISVVKRYVSQKGTIE